MSTFNWQQPAQKVGQQLAKLGLTYWNNPSVFSNALPGAEAGAAYGADVAGLSGAGSTGAGAGASGFSGLGVGGVASVLAPLVMGYMAYTGGSHRNEPVEKYQETQRIGKLMSDLMNGKKVDWTGIQGSYGIMPKYLSQSITGINPTEGGTQTIDPRGWTPRELYDQMIQMSAEYPQTGGVGDSWFTGNKINEAFGSQQDKLARLMGMDKLPDWTGHQKGGAIDYGGAPTQQADILAATMTPEQAKAWGLPDNFTKGGDITAGWNALDDAAKETYRQRAASARTEAGAGAIDDQQAVQQFADDQAIKQLNDQYGMGLETWEQKQARLAGQM